MNTDSHDVMNIQDILSVAFHRYPMLLVDKIHSINDKGCVGIKNVTVNEPMFVGHFPDHPVFPGVMIIESVAQAAAISLARLTEDKSKFGYLSTVYDTKFRKIVIPGDQLELHITYGRLRASSVHVTAKCMVEGKLVAEVALSLIFTNRT